jgi:hypothetical protein
LEQLLLKALVAIGEAALAAAAVELVKFVDNIVNDR